MSVNNLSANNSAEAIRNYRKGYDLAFGKERDIADAIGFIETWEMPRADAEILLRAMRAGSDDALAARLNYKRNFDLIYNNEEGLP